ncbi:hypothetical protein QF035_002661 [Streptomyces umbrinus]|uniref:Uncharacterized protein n=1 Tax=Streptomyces umbrinus TaxID=67370 RepID=A0ABU0SNE0_9ACTN|nr:hypothetical protein [Streptomyces umbrinus]
MTELVELGGDRRVYTQSAIEAEYMYDEIFRQGCYDGLDLGLRRAAGGDRRGCAEGPMDSPSLSCNRVSCRSRLDVPIPDRAQALVDRGWWNP